MKNLIIPILFCILIVSCKETNELEEQYADWNLKNIEYFNQMRDSSDYVLYKTPENRGGYSFYYKTLSEGIQTPENITDTSWVKFNFRGRFISGIVFDETYTESSVLNDSTAKPATYQLNTLVKGIFENLILMKIGEVRRIVLPKELGYGVYTMTDKMPPYSVTIWDIQLVEMSN